MLLLTVLLFAGVFLVVHSIYEERLRAAEDHVKIEYRFVPRSYYEEQMDAAATHDRVSPLFLRGDPQFDIASLDVPRKGDIKPAVQRRA
jgi:hypothetical protein